MNIEYFTLFIDEENKLNIDVIFYKNTIWVSKNEIDNFFQVDNLIMTEYIQDILDNYKIDEKNILATVEIESTLYYNEDIIIELSYRLNSQSAIAFRKWMKSTLKNDIFNRESNSLIKRNVSNEIPRNDLDYLLTTYEKGLKILDDYDHDSFSIKKGKKDFYCLDYTECIDIIRKSTFSDKGDYFAVERDDSFKSSIREIYQTFEGKEIYPTIEEKAAQLLYLITKNHSFIDGNKRIAAIIFLYFLMKNDKLRINDKLIVSNEAIAYLTVLIAISRPEDQSIVIDLIKNLITF